MEMSALVLSPTLLQTPCFHTCHPDILRTYPTVNIQEHNISTKPPLRNARILAHRVAKASQPRGFWRLHGLTSAIEHWIWVALLV